MGEYVLGTSDFELERLKFQHQAWSGVTAQFLDGLALAPGQNVADVGCGPGYLVEMLRERVGEAGRVLAIDASARWIDHIEERRRNEAWGNVEAIRGRLEEVFQAGNSTPASLDLIVLRWVLSFVPDPAQALRDLAHALKPGGRLAVMDYNHEGVSLFPRSDGFLAAIRATRELYAKSGGDTWIMGRISGLFREAGLDPVLFQPHVLAGGPGSPAFQWAALFFPHHTQNMVDQGLLSVEERDLFLREWNEREQDPDALFFSPIVVGAAARKS